MTLEALETGLKFDFSWLSLRHSPLYPARWRLNCFIPRLRDNFSRILKPTREVLRAILGVLKLSCEYIGHDTLETGLQD